MLIAEYFIWHYFRGAGGLLVIFRNYLKFFWNFFSIGLLLGTLFFPWKKDITPSGWRGFHPLLLLRKVSYNFFAIFIGLAVRVPVIAGGLLFEAATILFGTAAFIFWIFLPLILIFSGSLLVNGMIFDYPMVIDILSIFTFILAIAFSVISLLSFGKSKKKRPEEMDLGEMSNEDWFERVWNRLGFIRKDPEIKKAFSNELDTEKEMKKLGISINGLKDIAAWEIVRKKKKDHRSRFWEIDNLMEIEPIGKYWHFAYTVELDRYSYDLPRGNVPYSQSYLMGREKDIEMAELVLSRPSQNNILFIGEPGVGKRTLVNLLAKKIKEGKADPVLKFKRLVNLELDRIISDFSGNDLINELHRIFHQAAYAGNVIIVIENIHEYLAQKEDFNVDIANTLTQYLALPTFQVIGITTSSDFHLRLERKASVMKYFDKIIIDEMSQEQTMHALLNFLDKEEKERVLVTYSALEEIIKLSDQYITDTPMPEKAVDILEEVLIYWSKNSKNYFVMKEDVDKVFSDKIKIPLGPIKEGEKEKLVNLEKILKKRVIGQDEIIKQISEAMLRARAGISDQSKPIGSFLFLGSTGVGKTETAKALAEAYFGSEERMIRLDMSEYQSSESIGRILGDEKTGEPSKFLSEVSESPFSVLLLDEIEKAYPEILNLFLQILDEGWLTDAFGKKAIFKNMIIIATSNAGAEIIKDGIEGGYSNETIHKQVIDYAIAKGIFRPEFLNRFENVLFFRSLSGTELEEVTALILKGVAKRVYKNKNIRVNFGKDLIGKIIEEGYDPIFGARSIKHFIQDKIEDVLAKKIIEGKISEGEDLAVKGTDL